MTIKVHSRTGTKITACEFLKGKDSIIIKALFADEKFDEDGYTAPDDATEKEIADQDGWLREFDDGVCFDYIEDGKIVEIIAPDEKVLESLIKSSDD